MAEDEKVVLIAPAEGIWGPYRAQAASGLRVDAWPRDVPNLLTHGFVRAAQESAAAPEEAGPAPEADSSALEPLL